MVRAAFGQEVSHAEQDGRYRSLSYLRTDGGSPERPCCRARIGAERHQFKHWNPASDEVQRTPKITCEDLRSLTGYEFSIITATVITATEGTPEHCRVAARALAQNGNQFKDWNPASDEVRRTPKITCEDLRTLTDYEFSI